MIVLMMEILVVEDERLNSLALALMIQELGHSIPRLRRGRRPRGLPSQAHRVEGPQVPY
jgi:hypothetical protein